MSPSCRAPQWRPWAALLLPLLLAPLPLAILPNKVGRGAYALLLMAAYWVTEAIPIPVTALLPVLLFPLLGISSSDTMAREYLKDSIQVFIGGLLVALAFEYSGLHKRVALRVMLFTGASLTRLMLGTMVTTAFLSMWMFNTATTAMMVPIILAVLDELSKSVEEAEVDAARDPAASKKSLRDMRTMFLLSTAYSSNIGGTGVITGSGTNLVALEFLGDLDPALHGPHASLSFALWTTFNLVPMTINILVAWLYLRLVYIALPCRSSPSSPLLFTPALQLKVNHMLRHKYNDLGPLTLHEGAVGLLFLFAVTSWVLHDPKFIPGWGQLFSPKVSISTATLLVGALFFVIPRSSSSSPATLLDWPFVQRRFPWGVILLLGGGYALSKGAKEAGVNEAMGEWLRALAPLPAPLLQLATMTLIALMTEVTSNTATASIVIPILLELSARLNLHPFYLTLPATVTCSYAFMLPVATPPNAIVYAAGEIGVGEMMRVGAAMNLACVVVLWACTNLYGNLLFHFSEYNNSTLFT